jgi:hypothetical protein
MDFNTKLTQFTALIPSIKEKCLTEEATKHSLVMPFINLLGYDVFNPLEVVPEFNADLGIKKGEKIDYAIIKDNQPVIFIECKNHEENLNIHHSQLFRYFSVTPVKFAILTNGIKYQFYTDLEEVNKMDLNPFFEIDLLNLRSNQIEELKKFHKENFDSDLITSTAAQLKLLTTYKNLLEKELSDPSEDFVRYFAKSIYDGRLTPPILAELTALIKKGSQQYINEIISNKLKLALNSNNEIDSTGLEQSPDTVEKDKGVTTTPEEMEGFYIIKSIVGEAVDLKRIFQRDNQSYFTILLDDKNYKWFVRLYFNTAQKYLVLNQDKKEIKVAISGLDELYKHKSLILESLKAVLI